MREANSRWVRRILGRSIRRRRGRKIIDGVGDMETMRYAMRMVT